MKGYRIREHHFKNFFKKEIEFKYVYQGTRGATGQKTEISLIERIGALGMRSQSRETPLHMLR